MTMAWYPDSKGFASAFSFFGFGFGEFIFPQFQSFYINSKNLAPDTAYSSDYPNEKWIIKLFYSINNCLLYI